MIPSADLEKSLRFWVEGLGLTRDQEMRQEGRLVGCMVPNEYVYFWLNQRAGTSLSKKCGSFYRASHRVPNKSERNKFT